MGSEMCIRDRVKIDADLAVDDITGAQGNVKFLLAPRIDRD